MPARWVDDEVGFPYRVYDSRPEVSIFHAQVVPDPEGLLSDPAKPYDYKTTCPGRNADWKPYVRNEDYET